VLGSRRRKVGAALVLTVVLAIAGAVSHHRLTSGYSGSDASWQLLGVSADGRTLVIREPDHGACDRVESRLRGQHDDRVEVSVKLLEPRGSYDCVAMLLGGKVTRLHLDRPIAGRRITGPKKLLRPPYRVDMRGHADRSDPTTTPRPVPPDPAPRVVGLRYHDARDALCNAGYEAVPSARRGTRGEVLTQAAPKRRPRTGPPRVLTCSNGLLPAVSLTTGR
jgi:hypothetical protein